MGRTAVHVLVGVGGKLPMVPDDVVGVQLVAWPVSYLPCHEHQKIVPRSGPLRAGSGLAPETGSRKCNVCGCPLDKVGPWAALLHADPLRSIHLGS